jgi:hypothetical protein
MNYFCSKIKLCELLKVNKNYLKPNKKPHYKLFKSLEIFVKEKA